MREREKTVGGSTAIAASLPGMDRLRLFVSWLETECRREGASITTGDQVGYAELEAHPARVDQVLAAGTERLRPMAEATLREVRKKMGLSRPEREGSS